MEKWHTDNADATQHGFSRILKKYYYSFRVTTQVVIY
jgi:hypothetical protein